MARNETVLVPASTWTQLTNSDATAVTFQNLSGGAVRIRGTAGTTAPTDFSGALWYNPTRGEASVELGDLFPGISGVNRLWAWSESTGEVMISHA
jgi:hypothetical protein